MVSFTLELTRINTAFLMLSSTDRQADPGAVCFRVLIQIRRPYVETRMGRSLQLKEISLQNLNLHSENTISGTERHGNGNIIYRKQT